MKLKKLLFLLLILHVLTIEAGNGDDKRQYSTSSTSGKAIIIDGRLNDDAWNLVEWSGDFVQRQPEYGAEPSEETQFKILYDAKFLYIGIRAFDSEPDKIVRRMSRRDGFEGDWVEVNIDSYFDKRTAFSFTASVSGVKGDEYISNNGNNWDGTWDPIWYLETSIDDQGWIAEFKIPLSQLRFSDKENHTWGIQMTRRFFRNEERSTWQPIAQDAPGWVHLFGELNGIKGIKPQKQLEIQPYFVSQVDKTPGIQVDKDNPFTKKIEPDYRVGMDAKIGLTSDITLDLTVNPDFGQVEADPSQVNLSAFRLFFRERRPFFLESNNITDFRLTQSVAGGNFGRDNLFYSRRIGKAPSYFPDGDDINYVDQPENTRILGAAKLTGKNAKGFSWGVVESLTNQVKATVEDTLGKKSNVVVEPMTNYFVGRVQQDFDEGKTVIGAMFTATNRKIGDDHLDFLHTNAYSGGVDVRHNFNDRRNYISFNTAFSRVEGSKEAILGTQTASERYYQRPDNKHKNVDSTLTSLSGNSSTFTLGKSEGTVVYQTGFTYRTPGFEINDLGFLVQTDFISQWSWAQYRILKPFGIFRSVRINGNQYLSFDFDGINTYKAVNFNAHTQFKNFWYFGNGITIEGQNIANSDLRGGPSITYPGGFNYWYSVRTNDQKKFSFSLENWVYKGFDDFALSYGFWSQFKFQPTNAVNFRIQPSVSWRNNEMQYVTTVSDGGNDQYIVSEIDQITYRVSIRNNINITPNLTVELWFQPFFAAGKYNNFKKITDSNASEYNDRFHAFSDTEISYLEGEYGVDEDGDGNNEFDFSDPDFSFFQFRSNCVLRWEYIPGSTLFVVWSPSGYSDKLVSEKQYTRHFLSETFDVDMNQTFLVKYTYRFIL